MSSVAKEKCFPRGGTKPTVNLPKKGNKLFGKPNLKGRSKSKPSKKAKYLEQNADPQFYMSSVPCLERLSEGILILGCVRKIEENKLSLSLPGGLIGEISSANISKPYTRSLENLVPGDASNNKVPPLEDMFTIGQNVVARVLCSSDRLELSMMPEIVQCDWNSRLLTEGCVVIAAVSSCEENCYIMDTGIKNVRAFVKKRLVEKYMTNWNDGRPLFIGQVMRCLVQKSDISHATATVELSIDPLKLCESLFCTEFILDTLLPGTVLNISVSEVLINGLKVDCDGKFMGYVHEHHLSNVWDTSKNYSPGDVHQAVLLYVMPTTRLVFVSLKEHLCNPSYPSLDSLPLKKVKIGDVHKAKVEEISKKNIILRLYNKYKGVVYDYTKIDKIDGNLEIGSKHDCRVLGYDFMSQLFSCTLNKKAIEAEYLFPSDLKPGMKVTCQIKKYVEKGAIATIDAGVKSITSFIRNEHIGNFPLINPEQKFPVGSKHIARVLQVTGDRVQLTLKSKLVESSIEPLLCFDDAFVGRECEGVVMLKNQKGVLITFYDDVKGFMVVDDPHRLNALYLGQVIRCYIVMVDRKNHLIKLNFGNSFKTTNEYKVIITDCSESGLKVKCEAGIGIIPTQHLSDIPELANLLLRTYKPGDVINSYCFCTDGEPIFTLRPSFIKYCQSNEVSKVAPMQLIPCAIKDISLDDITLQLPIIGDNIISVPRTDLTELVPAEYGSDIVLPLAVHQGLMCKVICVDPESQKPVKVTVKVSQCWDKSPVSAISLLQSYWEDYKLIRTYMKKEGNPLAKLKPGDRVKGIITKVQERKIVINLECGVTGIVLPHQCENKWKCGEKVEGTVIFIDFKLDCCELTIDQTIMERINIKQDGKLANGLGVGTVVKGEILSVRPQVAVVVLKGKGRQQLAYVSTKCHVNDIVSEKLKRFDVGETVKMKVMALERKIIMCFQKEFEYKCFKLKTGHIVNLRTIKKKHKKEINPDIKNDKNNGDVSSVENQNMKGKGSKTVKRKLDNNYSLSGSNNGIDDNSIGVKEKEVNVMKDKIVKGHLNKKKKENEYDKNGAGSNNVIVNSNNSNGEHCDAKYFNYNRGSGSSDDNNINSNGEEGNSDNDDDMDKNNSRGISSNRDNSSSNGEEDNGDNMDKNNSRGIDSNNDNSSSDEEERYDDNMNKNDLSSCLGEDNGREGTKLNKRALEEDQLEKLNCEGNGKKHKLGRCDDDDEDKYNEQLTSLSLNRGFVWNADPSLLLADTEEVRPDDSSDEQGVEEKKKKKKLSKAERRERAQQEEQHLRAVEQKLTSLDSLPQSADEFDRLVLSSPNSSLCWIKYMAFHLQATEIEKARAIAKRALSTISFREEQEKLNVWCALLSLENLYGTKDSLKKVLEEAVQMNDSLKVYLQMLQIYADSNKVEEAEKLISVLTKKFRDNKEAWIQSGEILLKLGRLEKARSLMQKALNSLEKKVHVEVISKYAQLENQLGEHERAQALLEHVLTSYPKRTDIWNVYVDMLVKNEQYEAARQVLERAVAQKLPVRKMKSLFTKFLQFEKRHGTPEGAAKVRQMAVDYVDAACSPTEG